MNFYFTMKNRVSIQEVREHLLKMPFVERIGDVGDVLACRPSLLGDDRNISFEDILSGIETGRIPVEDLKRRLSKKTDKNIESFFGKKFDGLAQAISPEEGTYNLYLDEECGDNLEPTGYAKAGTLIVNPDISDLFEEGLGDERTYLMDFGDTYSVFLDFTLRQSLVSKVANELSIGNCNGLGFAVTDVNSVLDFNPLLLGMWKYDKVVNSAEYRQKLDDVISQVDKAREDIYGREHEN